MLVAVGMVLNEDDIVEAFVRHTAAHVDRIVLLDDGSTDRTLDILRALRNEGLPVAVLQSTGVQFMQGRQTTMLYHAVLAALSPDWVLPLDVDEFVDTGGASLRDALAAVPAGTGLAFLPLRNHFAPVDAPADLLVPRRMTLRDAAARDVWKCAIRGGLAGLTVMGGNHGAAVDGVVLGGPALDGVVLAHFPVRDAWAGLAKSVLGRLKVLATGTATLPPETNQHYTWATELLRSDPARLLHDAPFMANAPPPIPLEHHIVAYAGGPLRYTEAGDPAMKAVRRLMHWAEQLARSHGTLLDTAPELRARLDHDAMTTRLLD